MSRGLAPLLLLARPPDPEGAEAERAAVRILARCAMREGPRRRRGLGRLARAALAAGLVLAIGLPGGSRDPGVTGRPAFARLDRLVTAALSGEAAARRRVLEAGGMARPFLLEAAREGAAVGRAALGLLSAGGGVADGREADLVARLTEDPSLRDLAVDLLARSRGPEGPDRIGRLVARRPELEASGVEALRRVAEGGRREAALEALLAGTRAGSAAAAVAVLETGRGAAVDRLLAAAPEALLESPSLARAVREQGGTVEGRLLRLAYRGDRAALALCASAGIERVVPTLLARALDSDPEVAREAVGLLGRTGGLESWLALARALDGLAFVEAGRALADLPPSALDRLRAHAVSSVRDRPAAELAVRAAVTPFHRSLGESAPRAASPRVEVAESLRRSSRSGPV